MSKYFPATEYVAHNQNWAITQDSSGVMYFGNTDALLRFDGSEWQRFNMPKGGIVRSLALGHYQKIYAGAQGEFGFLSSQPSGGLVWKSLSDSLPDSCRAFTDVWRVLVLPQGILFQSSQYLFLFDHRDRFLGVWKADRRFRLAHWVRDRLVVQGDEQGLFELKGDSLVFVEGSDVLAKTRIYAMLPHGDRAVLIQTRADGTWLWEADRFRRIQWPAGRYLEEQLVYYGLMTSWGDYLFGTVRNGIARVDQDGRLVEVYDKKSGLPDNSVYCIFVDRTEGVWVAMNKGISRLEMFGPIRYWNEAIGLESAVFSVARHDTDVFIGTNTGLFTLRRTSSFRVWEPRQVEGIDGQCWSMLSHQGSLLCATSAGMYQFSRGRHIQLTSVFSYVLLPSKRDSNCVYVGLFDGLGRLTQTGNGYRFQRLVNTGYEIRYLAEEMDGSIWMAGGVDGFVRVFEDGRIQSYHPNDKPAVRANRLFGTSHGILFLTDRGLVRYDTETDRFVPDTTIAPILPDGGIRLFRVSEDTSGHLWISRSGLINKDQAGKVVYDPSRGFVRYQPLPRVSEFGDISFVWAEGRLVWFGGYDGVLQFKSPRSITGPVSVESYPGILLTARLRNDSVLYVGRGICERTFELDYSHNEVRFSFADPGTIGHGTRDFRYRLKGYEDEWTTDADPKKTYMHLPEGQYTFEIASTEPHSDARLSTFPFVIQPPLYRTWWAYILMAIASVLTVGTVVRIRNVYLEKDRRRLQNLVDQKTAELRVANEELRDSTIRLEKTIGIVEAVNSELELDKVVDSIFVMIQPVLHMESGSFLLRQGDSDRFQFRSAFGVSVQELKAILTEDEVIRRYVEHGEPVAEDMYFIRGLVARAGSEKFARLKPIDSLFVIRLAEQNRLAGFLFFDDVREVTPQDLLLLTGLKEHLRVALTKARLLNELRLSNEKKNEYLGIVAHDLRNPLSTIVGYTDLLIEDFAKNRVDSDGAVEDLRKIAGVSRHMNRFIAELLDISSIESGKVRMELRPGNMKSIVSECEYLHQRAATNKNIELTIEHRSDLPDVAIDIAKVSSVVDNLLSNAIKYTHPGGRVRVYFETGDREVITHIEDTGQGLSTDDLAKVFTSFKRLSSKPTAGEPSTGLGLAIVKKIVELHGGRVWVHSRLGEGSIFSFSLPRVIEASA